MGGVLLVRVGRLVLLSLSLRGSRWWPVVGELMMLLWLWFELWRAHLRCAVWTKVIVFALTWWIRQKKTSCEMLMWEKSGQEGKAITFYSFTQRNTANPGGPFEQSRRRGCVLPL